MGQNFLHESGVVRHIAQVAEIEPDDLVVEIGPGLGVLTRELSARAGRVIAVELDHRLAEYIRSLELPNTELVEADILQVDLKGLTGAQRYVVVANLPYSVAAAAIAHLLESEARPVRIIVMVQREVAERIIAAPPQMNLLSIAVQLFGTPRIMFKIGPGAFVPAPKVDSAVIKIDVFEELPIADTERKAFFRIVKAGFRQKRKQLANAISAALAITKDEAEQALTDAGIDPTRRAQTLSLDDWVKLHATLASTRTDD
jgi:16S rRNA (adenine1518-N6/adenine1519-N6)-dimethyltransferase